jgi:hypothetical protein
MARVHSLDHEPLLRRDSAWRPRQDAPAFDPGRYSPEVLKRAVNGWQRLYADERDSVVAATLVATDLARLGAPPELLGMASRVIEDEVRHTAVCATVIEALGSEPVEPDPDTTRASLGKDGLEVRVARTLIAGFAVGEAMSAGGFALGRTRSREPLMQWAYTELLRDESRHGAFGADAGAWAIRNWSVDQKLAFWPLCVREMEFYEQRVGGPVTEELLARERQRVDLEMLEGLGILRGSEICRAMTDAVPRWVLPRLVALGVVPMAEPVSLG